MTSYSIARARDRFASVVHEAEAKGPVRITRNGHPVAVLVSVAAYERALGKANASGPTFLDHAREMRETLSPAELDDIQRALRKARRIIRSDPE